MAVFISDNFYIMITSILFLLNSVNRYNHLAREVFVNLKNFMEGRRFFLIKEFINLRYLIIKKRGKKI